MFCKIIKEVLSVAGCFGGGMIDNVKTIDDRIDRILEERKKKRCRAEFLITQEKLKRARRAFRGETQVLAKRSYNTG